MYLLNKYNKVKENTKKYQYNGIIFNLCNIQFINRLPINGKSSILILNYINFIVTKTDRGYF